MTTDTNNRIMQRFITFINSASETLAIELISQDALFYVPGQPDPMQGPAGYLSIIAMMRSGFPDIKWTLEDMVSEGDKIAARFTMRGTHQGNFFGVPATGKLIQAQAINFYHLSDGRFVKEYGQPDMLAIMAQIGAVPSR
ncbi:ester cyclase [Dyadobacter sp. CY312]|uniref:ester cyclase n=1 Tax=Dyadobacter sp. CY312 TaxID=2907303 RepID=UPI001F1D85C3|nr:ester cyclase [Dyadobacter sp. CY312]MCE7042607.1 ester cyclase [Dyadobacter sp. CY312]